MVYALNAINISLEEKSFSPGEQVRGKVDLDTRKPFDAEALSIALVGIEKIKQAINKRGGRNTSTRMNYLLNEKQQLAGAREYGDEEFSFQFKIPEDIFEKTSAGQVGSASAKVASSKEKSGGYSSRKIEWYLKAELVVPRDMNVSKKVEIEVQ